MQSTKENLLLTLRSRRIQNFKNQFKSVILEGYEIFGKNLVDEVLQECEKIYDEYIHLTPPDGDVEVSE